MTDTGKNKLETVQKIRERIRDEKKAEFAVLLSEEKELLEEMNRLDRQIEDHLDNWRRLQQSKAVAVDKNLQYRQHQNFLDKQQKIILDRLTRCRLTLEKKREELRQTDREVKVVENLRRRKEDRVNEESRRNEQKKIDEFTSLEKASEIIRRFADN